MSVIGEEVEVVRSTDPSKVGRKGTVVLETAKTLLLVSGGRKVRVEKSGILLRVSGSGKGVSGEELSGRLEDRLGARSR